MFWSVLTPAGGARREKSQNFNLFKEKYSDLTSKLRSTFTIPR